MRKALNRGTVLWTTVAVIALFCTIGLLYLMLQERDKRIKTEQKLSETEKAKGALEVKLDSAEQELGQLKEQAKLLAEQLTQEKTNYKNSLRELDKKEAQLKELEGSLTNEKQQRTSLANSFAQLKENYDRVEQQLKEAQQKVDELKKQIEKDKGKAGVELQRIIVKPKKQLNGKVLVVNSEFHFVVIDLGKKDGLNINDEFVVYQGAQEVGKVRVERIYDAMSSAAILPGSEELGITEESIVKSAN